MLGSWDDIRCTEYFVLSTPYYLFLNNSLCTISWMIVLKP